MSEIGFSSITEERKKSNLSEGEEPEVHYPFKISPFDKEALSWKSLTGSDVFLSNHLVDNNNSKQSLENEIVIENLHEFSDKFIESWSSKKPLINMEKPDEEDPVFMKVEGRHYFPLYAPYYKIVHNYLVCLKYTEITCGKWNHLNVTVDLACLTRYITIPSSNHHSDISNMVYHSSLVQTSI